VLNNHLLNQLNSALDINLARVKCLTLLVSSLLRHRTVNLTILATQNLSGAKNESCYRRFQNFFLNGTLPLGALGRFILGKIPKPSEGWVLSMDRTNWKHGKRHINILTIGVVVNKVAIPIVWKTLPQKTKRGNSNTAQRIAILKKLLGIIKPEEVRVLAMDREFGGKEWIEWLNDKGIGYVLRIKSNIIVGQKLARKHRVTRKEKATTRKDIWGMKLFFASKVIQSKGRRDSHLYVISNRFSGKEALGLYRMRWGIEQLFSHLKKRGFDLEATHMSDGVKLEKLFALVTLAFLFSFAWGCQLRGTRKVTKSLKRKSLFRQGLEDILRLLSNPHLPSEEYRDFVRWLEQPIFTSIFIV
jgi:transposase